MRRQKHALPQPISNPASISFDSYQVPPPATNDQPPVQIRHGKSVLQISTALATPLPRSATKINRYPDLAQSISSTVTAHHAPHTPAAVHRQPHPTPRSTKGSREERLPHSSIKNSDLLEGHRHYRFICHFFSKLKVFSWF